MRNIIYIGMAIILIFSVFSAGCGEKIPGIGNKTNTSKTLTPTPTLPPTIGNLMITTNPVGAVIYLENLSAGYEYRGVAPVNLTNISVGKYNLTLSLDGYSTSKSTVTVKGGETVKVSKTLSQATAKIDIKLLNATMRRIPPCIWTFIGTVENTGDIKIYNLEVTLTMKPEVKDFDVISKLLEYGDVAPGTVRPFGFDITVLCEGNYKAEWKWEGLDINNPDTTSDDKKVSGTIKF